MECAKVSRNIGFDCDKPIQAGVGDRMVIINFEDWKLASFDKDNTNEQIYKDVVLPSGTTGYSVDGQNNSNQPKVAFKRSRYQGAFNHQVKFIAFDLSPDMKQQIDKLTKGRVVVIIENNHRGDAGETSFEIYGADAGLVVPDGGVNRDPFSADTQGAYELDLASSELSLEGHMPATLFDTSYAVTKAVFDSLYIPS
jgi:hypothetical protein